MWRPTRGRWRRPPVRVADAARPPSPTSSPTSWPTTTPARRTFGLGQPAGDARLRGGQDRHQQGHARQLVRRLHRSLHDRRLGRQRHANLASALIVEAGELLEHFQWMTEAQSRELGADQKQAVAHEMADVLLYLVQLSSALNVDLLKAAQEKMVINGLKYPAGEASSDEV
jgi:dCTP diphosphatase